MNQAKTDGSRSSTGLDSNLAGAFAYLGGILTGVIFLVIEKEDRYVRFHAAQSVLTFGAAFLVHLALASLSLVGSILYVPFILAVLALWVFLMVKAVNGHAYKLPYVGELAAQQLRP